MSTTTTLPPADPYASRRGDGWKIVDRQDPVVWGGADEPLSRERLRQYAADGFLSLDQLLAGDEAALLLREAQRLAEAADPAAAGVIAEPGGEGVRSLFRVHRTSELFRKVACDPRIAGMARQILGEEVYIHQSRINFKPGFDGKEFFWHSDFETWHVEDGMPRMRAVSVSISLTESHEFNGPLMLVRGSHRAYVVCPGGTPEDHHRQSLRKQEYGVPSREALARLVQDCGQIVAPKGRPGSATLFDCNTMHGSVGNLSPWPRTNLFLVYNAVSNAVQRPFGGMKPRPEFLAEREAAPLGA